MKENRSLPAELLAGRTLIFQLARNDFKKKYAGSYLGIVWAFVQPVVTVMVYWFVFGMIRSSSPRPVPFVLWLIAGLIPWFFFQDGLTNGTNALLEYNYLVKNFIFSHKVMFFFLRHLESVSQCTHCSGNDCNFLNRLCVLL